MPDREKVIKGFECCHVMVHDMGPDKSSCGICPYKDVQTEEQIDLGGIECIAVLHDDAMAPLKKQEEHKFFVDESGNITPRPVVVRCKDCNYYDGDENIGIGTCVKNGVCSTPDWFCADGKRKEGRLRNEQGEGYQRA